MTGKIRQLLDRRLDRVRANFWCHVARGAFTGSGYGLITGSDFLAVLVTVLGFQPAVLGMLAMIPGLAQLAQLLAAPGVEAARRKKRLLLHLDLCKWLPLFVVCTSLALFGKDTPAAALVVIAAVSFVGSIAISVMVAAEFDLIAETVPNHLTSQIFGFSNAASSALGLGLAAVVGVLLARVAFPLNYASVYLISALLLSVSWFALSQVDEMPHTAVPKSRQSLPEYFRDLSKVLRNDGRYRAYLLYESVRKVGVYAGVFYAMVAVKHHGLDPAFAVGMFIAARQIAAMTGYVGFPLLAAKIGLRNVLAIGVVLYAVAAFVASVAPSGMWFVAIIFMDGLGGATTVATGTAFAMRIYPSHRRVGYTTLTSLVFTPYGILLPVVFGFAIQTFGYVHVFWISAALLLLSLLPLSRCVEEEEGGQSRPGSHEVKR